MKDVVLFLQNRATRAGAQTSLARLVADDALRALSPVVLLGETGWLDRWCQKQQIAHWVHAFPRSRALQGRLWGNRIFAHQIEQRLRANDWRPRVVIGNDHQDGLLARAVATCCHTPAVILLRTPGMSQRDFFKYGCNRADLIFAVGGELQQDASHWLAGRDIHLYREGLTEDEFLPPKAKCPSFPGRALVIGSEVPRKGWVDWVSALDRLESKLPDFRLDCDFTGPAPDPVRNDLQLEKPRRSQFRFLGRVENFRERVRDYDLAIHPSRHESFGLAPIEVLAAGVPLLCSRTGAITEVLQDERFLFEPGNVDALTDALIRLHADWGGIDPELPAIQRRIREKLSLQATARDFAQQLSRLKA